MSVLVAATLRPIGKRVQLRLHVRSSAPVRKLTRNMTARFATDAPDEKPVWAKEAIRLRNVQQEMERFEEEQIIQNTKYNDMKYTITNMQKELDDLRESLDSERGDHAQTRLTLTKCIHESQEKTKEIEHLKQININERAAFLKLADDHSVLCKSIETIREAAIAERATMSVTNTLFANELKSVEGIPPLPVSSSLQREYNNLSKLISTLHTEATRSQDVFQRSLLAMVSELCLALDTNNTRPPATNKNVDTNKDRRIATANAYAQNEPLPPMVPAALVREVVALATEVAKACSEQQTIIENRTFRV